MPKKAGSKPTDQKSDHIALQYFDLGTKIIQQGLTIEGFKRHARQTGLRATPDAYYKAKKLAEIFMGDRPGLVDLCRYRGDRRISWTQLIELMAEQDSSERERYAELIINEDLGAVALREIIRGTGNLLNQRPGAGRKRRDPRNVAEAAWRANREIENLEVTLVWLKGRESRRATEFYKDLTNTMRSLDRLKKSLEAQRIKVLRT